MVDAAVSQQLTPTGKLRVAIAIAPAPSAQFAIKDEATGAYRGVAVILGQALAKKLGVEAQLIAHNGSGEVQNSAADNKWDVAFLPVDEERKKFVDFGNAYHILQSTYLIAPGAKLNAVSEANRPGVRIGGVANTATFRTSNKTAPSNPHRFREGGRSGRGSARRQARSDRFFTRVAYRPAGQGARLAYSRWRFHEFDDVGGGTERKTGGTRLCERIHRGGEVIGSRPQGLRRNGA